MLEQSSEEFIKSHEIDRMVQYLVGTHGGPALDFRGAATIPITAGDHWFAGHGSGLDIGGIEPSELMSKLPFDGLREGETATLHLISCNLGRIHEGTTGGFAKHLRRLLQADPKLVRKTIVVEAPPAFIIQTPGARGSFTEKALIKEAHGVMKQLEARADAELGRRLWQRLRPVMQEPTQDPPKVGALRIYLAGLTGEPAKSARDALPKGDDPEYRRKVIEALDGFAGADPAAMYRSAYLLVKLIGPPAIDALRQVQTEAPGPSNAAWAEMEQWFAQRVSRAAPQTLTAGNPERKQIKEALTKRVTATVDQYGWIQYSTKGKLKPLA